MLNLANTLLDQGKGRALVFLLEEGDQGIADLCSHLAAAERRPRVICIELAKISAYNWKEITQELLELFKELKVRQNSLVAYGPASTIAQNLYLTEAKNIKSLVLIDPSTSPKPGLFQKVIKWLEAKLPLGLPFRSPGYAFDSRSLLQRIRCPVLVVLRSDANSYLRQEAELIVSACPTSMIQHLSSGSEELGELMGQIEKFQAVPSKCPQKNLRAA